MFYVLFTLFLYLHGAISQEKPVGPCACNAKTKTRVLFGETAKMNEFPFLAYIEANFGSETQACTGTAVSRKFVLSGAHCFRRLRIEQKCMHVVKPGDVTITMGSHFSNEKPKSSQTFKATKVIIHPGAIETYSENDMALLQLDKDIVVDDDAISIGCLYYGPRDKLEGNPAIITGWGENFRKANNTALQKGDTRIKPFFECRKSKHQVEFEEDDGRGSLMTLPDTTICAVADNALTTGSRGDSGGPLLVNMNGNLQIVAVISSLEERAPHFAFFSLVSPVMNWILDTANATECQKLVTAPRTPDAPLPVMEDKYSPCVTSGTSTATAWISTLITAFIFTQRL